MTRPRRPTPDSSIIIKTGVILLFPIILGVIHYLTPASFQQTLALDHTNPQFYNFWTSALVHHNNIHLFANLGGYLLLMISCWGISKHWKEERLFWIGASIIFVATPIVTSVSSYVAFTEILEAEVENERGFSGVVGGVAGLLFVYILDTFEKKQREPLGILSVGLYLSVLLASVGIMTGRTQAILIGIAVFTITIVAMRTAYVARFTELHGWYDRHPNLGRWLLIAVFVSAWAFSSLLPASMISENGMINVVSHGSGLVFGILVANLVRARHNRSSERGLAAA